MSLAVSKPNILSYLQELEENSSNSLYVINLLKQLEDHGFKKSDLQFMQAVCTSILGKNSSAQELCSSYESICDSGLNATMLRSFVSSDSSSDSGHSRVHSSPLNNLEQLVLIKEFFDSREFYTDLEVILSQPLHWIPLNTLKKIKYIVQNHPRVLLELHKQLSRDSSSLSLDSVDSRIRPMVSDLRLKGCTTWKAFLPSNSYRDALRETALKLFSSHKQQTIHTHGTSHKVSFHELHCEGECSYDARSKTERISFAPQSYPQTAELTEIVENSWLPTIAALFANGTARITQLSFEMNPCPKGYIHDWKIAGITETFRVLIPLETTISDTPYIHFLPQYSRNECQHQAALYSFLLNGTANFSPNLDCNNADLMSSISGEAGDALLCNFEFPHQFLVDNISPYVLVIDYVIDNMKSAVMNSVLQMVHNETI